MTDKRERIDDIRRAASEYGLKSVENMKACAKIGRDIISAFDRYLTIDGDLAIGVPPFGDWNPELGDARDAAFSYYHERTLRLGDVQFGIGVRIDHLHDDGHFWIRIVVNLRKQGDRIAVFVGNGSGESPIWLATEYRDADLQPVCEKLYDMLVRLFRNEINQFVHGTEKLLTIGFAPIK